MTETNLTLRYRNLMKSALLGRIYQEDDVRFLYLAACRQLRGRPDPAALADPASRLAELYRSVLERKTLGAPWWNITVASADSVAPTLDLREWCDVGNCEDGDDRLEVAEELLATLQERNVDGNVLDIGPTRPGFAIFCRAYQLSSGLAERFVDVQVSKGDASSEVIEKMCATMRGLGMRDGIRFESALDQGTLSNFGRYALIRVGSRLDLDFLTLKEYIYPRLSYGGYLIFEGIYGVGQSARLDLAGKAFPGLQHLCLDIGGWRRT